MCVQEDPGPRQIRDLPKTKKLNSVINTCWNVNEFGFGVDWSLFFAFLILFKENLVFLIIICYNIFTNFSNIHLKL